MNDGSKNITNSLIEDDKEMYWRPLNCGNTIICGSQVYERSDTPENLRFQNWGKEQPNKKTKEEKETPAYHDTIGK